jgi:hypothetical protein
MSNEDTKENEIIYQEIERLLKEFSLTGNEDTLDELKRLTNSLKHKNAGGTR